MVSSANIGLRGLGAPELSAPELPKAGLGMVVADAVPPWDGAPSHVAPTGLEEIHSALEAAGFVQAPAPPGGPSSPSERVKATGRRSRTADLTVCPEPVLDYDGTAALAAEGFGLPPGSFRAETLRWLYERAFSDGTTVLAARSGDRKVGQIALVHQTIVVDGRTETAVALVDLFIIKAFRSRAAMAALYGAVEAFCVERGIRFIVAVPNGKAAPVNIRHLKLAETARLDIRAGLSGLPLPWRRVESHRVAGLDADRGRKILSRFCGGGGVGLHWTAERLWARLGRPGAGYALHAGPDVLLVSAPRADRRASHTLLCMLLARPGSAPRRADVSAVVSAACRLHRRPLFVYAGVNDTLPLPGMPLPARLRPSPMVLQLRDFRPGEAPLAFSRFEPLDFDFA